MSAATGQTKSVAQQQQMEGILGLGGLMSTQCKAEGAASAAALGVSQQQHIAHLFELYQLGKMSVPGCLLHLELDA